MSEFAARRDDRRRWLVGGLSTAACLMASTGCSSLWNRGEDAKNAALSNLMQIPTLPPMVGEATRPTGLQPLAVGTIGVVNSLPGTGGPPDPSADRETLLEDMKRENIAGREAFLEEASTAMVRVSGLIPPGARRGDSIDVQIQCGADANATNLMGGWLLDSRLTQSLRVAGNALEGPSLRRGQVMAIAIGPVLTRRAHENSDDPIHRLTGAVIGGGSVQQDRGLGLTVMGKYRHARVAAEIAAAINARFFFFDGASRRGIATATNESLVTLEVPPRYRDNVSHLMALVAAVPLDPSRRTSQSYLQTLGEQLTDPSTAEDAALKLEAIGNPAIPTLVDRMNGSDPAVRFASARALAFLDQPDAASVLAEVAGERPDLRMPAIGALRHLEDMTATTALSTMLSQPSQRTRFEAMRCLSHRGDAVRDFSSRKFATFRIVTTESPSPIDGRDAEVLASLSRAAEIVAWSDQAPVRLPSHLRTAGGVMVQSVGEGRLAVDRFMVDAGDRHAEVPATLRGLLEGLGQVQASYGETLMLLREATEKGYVDASLDCF